MNIWIYGYMDIWIYSYIQYMNIWIYGQLSIQRTLDHKIVDFFAIFRGPSWQCSGYFGALPAQFGPTKHPKDPGPQNCRIFAIFRDPSWLPKIVIFAIKCVLKSSSDQYMLKRPLGMVFWAPNVWFWGPFLESCWCKNAKHRILQKWHPSHTKTSFFGIQAFEKNTKNDAKTMLWTIYTNESWKIAILDRFWAQLGPKWEAIFSIKCLCKNDSKNDWFLMKNGPHSALETHRGGV